jgi:hypothetical protein
MQDEDERRNLTASCRIIISLLFREGGRMNGNVWCAHQHLTFDFFPTAERPACRGVGPP